LSVKWHRRKKRSRWFDGKYRFSHETANQKFKTKNEWIKRQAHACRHRSPKYNRKKGDWKEPEPLIDVLEEKDEIIVVAELAGFKKENIKIDADERELDLSADGLDRKYRKSLNLPKSVIPNTARTKYKNGVFEIRLKKAPEEKTIDKIVG
jgi:HSP20 family molecular chaperone IbpA